MAIGRSARRGAEGGALRGRAEELLIFRPRELRVSLRPVGSLAPDASLAVGVAETPLGACSIGLLGDAIAWLAFGESAVLEAAHDRVRCAGAVLAPAATHAWTERLFGPADAPLAIALVGTPFQLRVWAALLSVPFGSTTTYGDLAAAIDRPGAARAVGRAVGANPLAVVVPCHRVVRGDGALGGYRWGAERKQELLAAEGIAFAT